MLMRYSPVTRMVSPAHAGIDPTTMKSAKRKRRFPRPRGDRPRNRVDLGEIDAFPPPTRG